MTIVVVTSDAALRRRVTESRAAACVGREACWDSFSGGAVASLRLQSVAAGPESAPEKRCRWASCTAIDLQPYLIRSGPVARTRTTKYIRQTLVDRPSPGG